MMNIPTRNRNKINSFTKFIVIVLLGLLLMCLPVLLSESNALKESEKWRNSSREK